MRRSIVSKGRAPMARAEVADSVVVGVELDAAVAELLGGRINSGPVGALLGEARGPYAIAAALTRSLALDPVL